MRKSDFTVSDIENNLYGLATSVNSKSFDPKKVIVAISAYNAIIRLQALKLRAHSMLPKANPKSMLTDKKSLTLK